MLPRISRVPLLCLAAILGSTSHAATITGVVNGPDSWSLRRAFVEAQNTSTHTTVAVLSDETGRYRIGDLQAGEYEVSVRAIGYGADPVRRVTLASDTLESLDLVLLQSEVRWSDLSIHQAKELFPEGRGSDLLFDRCAGCHAFQNEMASSSHDAEGWKTRVEYERTTYGYALAQLSAQDVEEISYYLARLFGPNSLLEKSPAARNGEDRHAGYQDTVPKYGGDSQNIVYVEYDVPPPGRFPVSAAPDNTGRIWIANGGTANRLTRLQPHSGELQDFSIPHGGAAEIDSLTPAPNGSIWFAERGPHKLGRWDPETQKIVEYADNAAKAGGSKYTVRLHANGTLWLAGIPLTKFDPKTRLFTRFEKVADAYDLELDTHGNAWFTDPANNKIGRVDQKTLSVSQWELPTSNAGPRRLQAARDGVIWVTEFHANKLASFDPATKRFKEYVLPGAEPSPWALAFDADGYLWYSSYNMDEVARFDTKTGKATRYPFPHSEITAQEFIRDSAGRIWYGSPANHKVGYFYLRTRHE
jgi:virginiamycin B lyase